MKKCRMLLITAAGISVLWTVSSLSAKTWYLGGDQDWKEVPAESKEAYVQANTLFSEGKLVKAARSYDKFLAGCDPNSELYQEALQRQFQIGREFLAGRKKTVLGVFRISGYAEGEKIMDRISDRAGGAIIGTEAALEVAQSYEQRGESDEEYYELAYLKWSDIFDSYDRRLRVASSTPTGELGKDSLLGMARCLHAAYRGPEYDASSLMGRTFGVRKQYDSAKSCYEGLRLLYPEESEKFDADGKLKQLNEQLAWKDFSTGQYYEKTGSRQAANLYYQMVVRQWPGTKAAEMANETLSKNLSSKETEK
ncbi:MAG TPA: outer membrane protein assembly factor BamD [Sedimentisphaerales bacterium]|nr:outer membrane protein assembly factor BamD [Sedimentisphaerales bacterium]